MKLAKKLSTLLIALLIVVAACGFTKATKVSASEEKKQITVTADAEAAEVVDEAADASAVSGKAFGAALVVGLAAAAGAIAMGMSVAKSSEAIARQPEASGAVTRTMFVGCAVAESTGIYGLIIALLLIFLKPFT